MPLWVSVLLWKVILPDAIVWLQNHGYFNAAEALAAKGAVAVVNDIRSIKIYSAPSDYPNEPNSSPSSNNLQVKQPPE